MSSYRIAMYCVIAFFAVLIGIYYLHCEVPHNWHWPTNIVQLFTRR